MDLDDDILNLDMGVPAGGGRSRESAGRRSRRASIDSVLGEEDAIYMSSDVQSRHASGRRRSSASTIAASTIQGNGTVMGFAEAATPFSEILGSSPPQSAATAFSSAGGPRSQRRTGIWAEERGGGRDFLGEANGDVGGGDHGPAAGRRAGRRYGDRASSARTIQDLDDREDTVPMIPDLDQVQEEDLIMKTAEAPSVAMNTLLSYQELSRDLLKHAAFSSLDDINLIPLTRFLLPERVVREPDLPWNWDNLIADLSSARSSASARPGTSTP